VDRIIVEKAGKFIEEREFEGDLTIGRDDDNDLILDDENRFVSRKHVKIEKRGEDVFVVDLKSRNGTIIDGEKIDEYKIEEDTDIELGMFRIKFIKEKKKGYGEEVGTIIRSAEPAGDGTMVLDAEEPEEAGTMIKSPAEEKEKSAIGEMVLERNNFGWVKYALGAGVLAGIIWFLLIPGKTGMIIIKVQPNDAQVFVNGIEMPSPGDGKLKGLQPGEYDVRVFHPDYFRAVQGKFKISGKNKLLRLKATPDGVEVIK